MRKMLALVLVAYVAPLWFPVPLMEDDEGLHAAIALEMVEGGDWTVPRLMGEPFLDKPTFSSGCRRRRSGRLVHQSGPCDCLAR